MKATEEWVIAADRDSGLTLARRGFKTAREAGAVRREMERHINDEDDVNFLLLTYAEYKAIQIEGEP